MDEHLIDYLIYEGYANTESSAYKILSVISEEFYEYLLYEALTPEQRAAGRARTARRREETGIPEPDAITSAEIRGRIRNRKPSTSGGYLQTTETKRGTMRTPEGAYLPPTGTRRETTKEKKESEASNEIIASDGTVKPITFVDNSGRRREVNVTAHSGSSLTMAPPKKGQRGSQQRADNPHRDVGVGPELGGVDVYSGKRRGTSRTTSGKKKLQTPQPQAQRTTRSGRPVRVRTSPSQAQTTTQQPTRATSARRKPQPQTPTPTSSTPQRKPTRQELERQERPIPTNRSADVAKPVNPTRLATGITRRRPQITGIQRQNPNK